LAGAESYQQSYPFLGVREKSAFRFFTISSCFLSIFVCNPAEEKFFFFFPLSYF
jgi:hypothetical protein